MRQRPPLTKTPETHPWIDFRLDLTRASIDYWRLLGEAVSKCRHIARVAIKPNLASELYQVYLSKGVHATTSIEGNTLSEIEVLQEVRGQAERPESQRYQRQAVRNIIGACNDILRDVMDGQPTTITVETIQAFNRSALHDLELDEGVEPGVIRAHEVTVGSVYRGAPPAECGALLQILCDTIAEHDAALRERFNAPTAGVIVAMYAHLYLAWIHPFGDGNGRTARLVELAILMNAGVPSVSAHLLSNHYNATRPEYYRKLREASTSGGPGAFYEYAIRGLVDGLREQLKPIHEQNLQLAWNSYLHDVLPDGGVNDRRRHLVIDLEKHQRDGRVFNWPLSMDDLPHISFRTVEAFKNRTERTLRRDLSVLGKLGLISRSEGKLVISRKTVQGLLPPSPDYS